MGIVGHKRILNTYKILMNIGLMSLPIYHWLFHAAWFFFPGKYHCSSIGATALQQVDADLKELDEPARPLSYERVLSSCESLHLACL